MRQIGTRRVGTRRSGSGKIGTGRYEIDRKAMDPSEMGTRGMGVGAGRNGARKPILLLALLLFFSGWPSGLALPAAQAADETVQSYDVEYMGIHTFEGQLLKQVNTTTFGSFQSSQLAFKFPIQTGKPIASAVLGIMASNDLGAKFGVAVASSDSWTTGSPVAGFPGVLSGTEKIFDIAAFVPMEYTELDVTELLTPFAISAGDGDKVTLLLYGGDVADQAVTIGNRSFGTEYAPYLKITYDTTPPTLVSSSVSADNQYVDLTFSEGVYRTSEGSGGLTASSLQIANFAPNGGATYSISIVSVKRNDSASQNSASSLTGGETTVRVFLNVLGTSSGSETFEIRPASGSSIYDRVGNASPASLTTGTKTLRDLAGPTLTGAVRDSDTKITVSLNENAIAGGLSKSNDGGFSVQETGNSSVTYAVSAIAQGSDAQHVVLTVANMGRSGKEGVTVKYTAGGNGTIADASGNAMATNTTGRNVSAWDGTAPSLSGSGAVAAANAYVDLVFSEGVYGDAAATVGLGASSLAVAGFAANGGTATAVSVEAIKRADQATAASATALSGGETTVRVFLKVTGVPSGVETFEVRPASSASVFDLAGNASASALTTGAKTLRDEAPPTVAFGTNGSSAPSRSASTAVTVADSGSGVDAAAVQYAWTTSAGVPGSGWASFASGDTLTKDGADGDWYLHVRVKDLAGNTVDAVSNPFLLDNAGPSVAITMRRADSTVYPANVWTNQDVTVAVVASDERGLASVEYSLDGGSTWDVYADPFELEGDGVYEVAVKAIDTAGNETLEERTVKISRGGLSLTPTLKKSDDSAYVSGDWTNDDVSVLVAASAGASGLSSLTYRLDGGEEQAYVSGAPIPFEQEGEYEIGFRAADTAGNAATETLFVKIDKTAPVIALTGLANVSLTEGDNYVEEGATATDAGGSGVAGSVTVTGTVDTDVPGTYTLRYHASDLAGNAAAEATRTVVVEERDETPPTAEFGTNGSLAPSRSASTTATISDADSGVDAGTLRYAWTQSSTVPADGWEAFSNGDTLTKDGADGEWYLHVQAEDLLGNRLNAASNSFLLDNTAPSVMLEMTQAGGEPYPDDTWTNREVTFVATASDANSVASVTYSSDGGATWQAYSAPLVLQEDGVYSLSVKVVDTAGNETVERRTAKISRSGLELTSTLKKEDESAYASGEWTNASVIVSVYAAAGSSGIASLSYRLDGGEPQAYASETPIRIDQEGPHAIVFQVVDAAGNTLSAPLAVNIDKTAPVLSLTGSATVVLTAGDAYAEEGATASDAGGSGVSGPVAVTGKVNTEVPGTYTLRYNVSDLAGNSATEVERTVVVEEVVTQPPLPGGTPSSSNKTYIDLNGILIDPSGIDLSKPFVTLEVAPKDGTASVRIPASVLTGFASRNAAFYIEIKAPYGSYRIPVDLAKILPELGEWLAVSGLKADEISFKITLTDRSGDKDIQAALAEGLPGGRVLGAIVDYRIEVANAKTGATIGTAETFGRAMTRIIPMPEDLADLPEQWGAFRYNEGEKSFGFVPAKMVKIDGTWYALIASYSNSAYVVAENEIGFADVRKHWAQEVVELAAAKGLVEGGGDGKFDPGRTVTRAEFASMLVRALSRGVPADSQTAPYGDVASGAWYSSEVAMAKELGLLAFVKGDRFEPAKPLAREEMASMLAAAIRLEKPSSTGGEGSLSDYDDIGKANPEALEAIRTMVRLQVMTGTGANAFNPKGITTRAEAAAVLVRTLRQLGSIE